MDSENHLKPRLIVLVIRVVLSIAAELWLASSVFAGPLWEPRAAPIECRAVGIHMLLQDISGSMAERGLLRPALEQHAAYVDKAPHCTYVIYAEFGTTAAVIGDAFLTSPAEREQLATKIRTQRPTHRYTNFQEAAKLVELVLLRIERAYAGVQWSFSASVISDHRSAPSDGNEPFDLNEYLAKLQRGTQIGVLELEVVQDGAVPTAEEVRRGTGRLTVSVRGLSEVLQARLIPVSTSPLDGAGDSAEPASTEPDKKAVAPPTESAQGTPILGRQIPAWLWQSGLGLAVLTVLAFWAVARRSGPTLPREMQKTPVFQDRVPRAVRLSEQVIDEKGAIAEDLRQHEEIPVAERVPVVFSSEQTADVPLRPVPGVNSGPVFTITPQSDGRFAIRGVKGLNVNGRAIGRSGVLVDTTPPVRIEFGKRRWTLAPVSGDKARVDDLLAMPRPMLNPTTETAAHHRA